MNDSITLDTTVATKSELGILLNSFQTLIESPRKKGAFLHTINHPITGPFTEPSIDFTIHHKGADTHLNLITDIEGAPEQTITSIKPFDDYDLRSPLLLAFLWGSFTCNEEHLERLTLIHTAWVPACNVYHTA